MAARLRPRHQDEVRTKIQTTQLLKVLQNHALGADKGKPEELTASRMKAAEILLRKTLPDVANIQIEAEVVHMSLAESLSQLNASAPDDEED